MCPGDLRSKEKVAVPLTAGVAVAMCEREVIMIKLHAAKDCSKQPTLNNRCQNHYEFLVDVKTGVLRFGIAVPNWQFSRIPRDLREERLFYWFVRRPLGVVGRKRQQVRRKVDRQKVDALPYIQEPLLTTVFASAFPFRNLFIALCFRNYFAARILCRTWANKPVFVAF